MIINSPIQEPILPASYARIVFHTSSSRLIPLYKVPIGYRENWAALSSLRTSRFSQSSKVTILEKLLCQKIGNQHAVVMSNGTLPLLFALKTLGIGAGDEVIVPSFTFVATANVVELSGAKPVFADIKISNYGINIDIVASLITNRTKAIIVVHEFGIPVDILALRKMLSGRAITIIEDAACALGSSLNGIPIGSSSDIATFSFHPRKVITSGEGGAIVTFSEEVAQNALLFRNHGLRTDSGEIMLVAPSINARLSEFQAALLVPQLKRLDKIIQKRELVALEYLKYLNHDYFHLPEPADNVSCNWQSFMVTARNSFDFRIFREYMSSRKITVARGAQFIPGLKYYEELYDLDVNQFPIGSKAGELGFCLPIYPSLKLKDVNRICRIVNEYFASMVVV